MAKGLALERRAMAKIKVSIYLIKQEIDCPAACIGIREEFYEHEAPGMGTLFYKQSTDRTPPWVVSFFPELAEDDELRTSSVSAVFIVPASVKGGQRLFALAFGYGRTMLDSSCYVERFGLKTVLNTVDPSALRKISRTTIAGNALKTAEQMPRRSTIDAFGIDIERDLLESVTAALPEGVLFGGGVTGADALSLSIPSDVVKLPTLLGDIYELYATDSYKDSFPWVDNIVLVKSKSIIERLNERVVRLIVDKSPDVWMAVPEVISWEYVAGFRFRGLEELRQDILIEDFLLSLREPLTEFGQIEHKQVCMVNSDGLTLSTWAAAKCLYGEVELDGCKYCINGGKWYEVEKGFAARIEKTYQDCALSELDFPDCPDDVREGEYNHALVESGDGRFALMDARNIKYGGGQSSIELCDVLTDDGRFIHVKKYAGSAPLSHLFNQGYVSTRLMKSDLDFRAKASKVLAENNPRFAVELKEDSVKEVVFGVITKDNEERPRLPFFSKVTFDAVRSNLVAMGTRVSVKAIHLV